MTHIGKMLSPERVESKWGVGHLYRYGLQEIPLQYGDEVEFFSGIGLDSAFHELLEFAKENGVRFEGTNK